MTKQDLSQPFLSPSRAAVVVEDPPKPHDDSAEGMRRLRDPFGSAAARPGAATTDDGSGGR